MIRLRPLRAYVAHFPVNSPAEARVLSRQAVWNVISYVREFGREGVSAGEISKSLNMPRSDVYTILTELVRQEHLSKISKVKGPTRERRTRYMVDKVQWGKYEIDESLEQALEREGLIEVLLQQLEKPVLEAFVNVHNELLKRGLGGILPESGSTGICSECGTSHETIDFFSALGLVVLKRVMGSPELRDFLARLGFSEGN